jgi:hypothetical protein
VIAVTKNVPAVADLGGWAMEWIVARIYARGFMV